MNQEAWASAETDFRRARGKATLSEIVSFLRGRKDWLLSLEKVKSVVKTGGESYLGCRTVPVERIVGSEGRSRDFNSSFLPRRDFLFDRWARVDSAHYEDKNLPAVKLLELGGVYFVRDGNHRVSVAKMHHVAYIDAEITRLACGVELEPSMALDQLICKRQQPAGHKDAACPPKRNTASR